MLHLTTEMYNNEKFLKILDRISVETCLKIDYLAVYPQSCQTLGARSKTSV